MTKTIAVVWTAVLWGLGQAVAAQGTKESRELYECVEAVKKTNEIGNKWLKEEGLTPESFDKNEVRALCLKRLKQRALAPFEIAN